ASLQAYTCTWIPPGSVVSYVHHADSSAYAFFHTTPAPNAARSPRTSSCVGHCADMWPPGSTSIHVDSGTSIASRYFNVDFAAAVRRIQSCSLPRISPRTLMLTASESSATVDATLSRLLPIAAVSA